MADKIKKAARARQRETGEPYMVARRAVIAEHEAARNNEDSVPALLSPGFVDWGPGGRPAPVTDEQERQLMQARPGFSEDLERRAIARRRPPHWAGED
jgi:hypothetical protein